MANAPDNAAPQSGQDNPAERGLFAADQARGAGDAQVVSVAVNANVWRTFDYRWPAGLGRPAVGLRVRVPLGRGNRATLGFVTEVGARDEAAGGAETASGWSARTGREGHPRRADATGRPSDARRLKDVAAVLDRQPQLDETLWRLGEWIGRYYLTPLGMVLAAMVPRAVGQRSARTEAVAYLAKDPHEWPRTIGARQRRLLDELVEARKQGVQPLEVATLLRRSGAARQSLKGLVRRELVRQETRPVRLPELSDEAGQAPFELNEDQQAALEALAAKLEGGFSVTVLHGVTGSGKTEVYVRAIRRAVAAGRQALLLVPEIALATQTLSRLVRRLPRVAVLHSGLSDAERAFYYEQIREGHAAVVVGPRSAAFAPARRLGLIVVDEEHEGSYKQDTAPRYHGRDVAIKRAQLADVPVLLGSATPSLETLHNVQAGRYERLRLPRRVRGLPMPRLEVVALRDELASSTPGPRRIELIGPTLTRKIAAALDRSEQVILLMNRRGFASYVFSPASGWLMMCPQCSRPMVYHRATDLAHCHYCGHTEEVPERCPVTGKKLVLFGFGIQRIEGELGRKFPEAAVARMDSDTMSSPRQFQEVLGRFADGRIDILLGTQMVGKGLDFPRVSLVGVVSADTALAVPDFRAAERTFQLIVQVAGRAGRGETAGDVVVQTLHPQEPAIQRAIQHDYDGFAAYELPLRRQVHLPPYSRIVRFVLRHTRPEKAQESAERLAERLRTIFGAGAGGGTNAGKPGGPAGVSLVGPQAAAIGRLRGRHRFEVRLIAERAGVVQDGLTGRMEWLLRGLPAEVLADADPLSFA